jgi:hypothetical protein
MSEKKEYKVSIEGAIVFADDPIDAVGRFIDTIDEGYLFGVVDGETDQHYQVNDAIIPNGPPIAKVDKPLVDHFNTLEITEIFEFARKALRSMELREHYGFQLDLSEDYLWNLLQKLDKVMGAQEVEK